MKEIFEKLNSLTEEDLIEISEVDSSELDEIDDVVSGEDIQFEKVMLEFFQELALNDDLTESFYNQHSLQHHYYKHCLAGRDLKSKRSNIYYDFSNVNDYKHRAETLFDKSKQNYERIIVSLLDKEAVLEAFRKLFEDGVLIGFSAMCGITDSDGKPVSLIFNSFANDVTTNYEYNTIDYMVTQRQHIKTIFPIDINYLQNKFNNVIQKNFPDLWFNLNGPFDSHKYVK